MQSFQMSTAGEEQWKKQPRINSEFFSLTYGALVQQILTDSEDITEVNQALFGVGQYIGSRLVDELFAKAQPPPCSNVKDTAEVICKVGFKMFFGFAPNWTQAGEKEFTLTFDQNPMIDFVELPDDMRELNYCNALCGVVVGALDAVGIDAECLITQDPLKGGKSNEFRVILKGSKKPT
ncbi:MAG: putative trafficking protein particle complex subunit 3 [Streblomastix strix]|uniref:Trafficking protein particle complex subunit n=1 Tax=Streblomastix strix TaxID=222440 RepID=A0A5J4WU18_9EUKA|nr:MAG: putative trafficking protein particle complex subunit 3 [Streblomastix strix]